MKALISLCALFLTAGAAFADHAVNNAAETARAAYRAADDAEALATYASRDGGFDYRPGRVGGGDDLEDHRHDTLRELAWAADRLHFSLSDLYRAARAASGGFGPQDHRGDRIREEFYQSQQDFWAVQRAHQQLRGYPYSREIDRIFYGLEVSMQRLTWTVNGGEYQ